MFVGKLTGLHDMDMRTAISILLGSLNLFTAGLFIVDKACAKCGSEADRYDFEFYGSIDNFAMTYRVAEVVLHYMTFFGSPVGALIGFACGHKTSKVRFKAITAFFLFFNLAWVFIYLIATNFQLKTNLLLIPF